MTEKEYESHCLLVNPKYQMKKQNSPAGKGESPLYIDTYDFVANNTSRIIQLSTVAKLTTDNSSLIADFPIDYDTYGLEPYNEYAIKINDAYGSSLYIFVHCKGSETYLFPVVMGFQTGQPCSPVLLSDNYRTRAIQEFGYMEMASSEEEFGIEGRMLVLNNRGLYGKLLVLTENQDNNLLKAWDYLEYQSLHVDGIIAFSSSSLIVQIWLHTICMWRKRCINRKVKIVHSNGHTGSIKDIRTFSTSKQTIIDINKDIIVYVNDSLSKREFKGYHMRESARCGHFRHLNSSKVIYIPPTIVHYKKVVPNKYMVEHGKPIVYRNTEDFLKEKSYLENDVMLMLKGRGIEYEREKMFDWMGRNRLDFFLPDMKIAIECQGVQHFYRYGSNDSDFDSRKQRDRDKYNECKSNGITVLYYASPDIPIPQEMAEEHTYITNLNDLYSLLHN